MKIMRLAITILIVCFLVSGALAQEFDNVGTSAANFLKIGVGSRANAMGGAFVAQADDASAVYWNVAGLANIENTDIMFSANDWIADVTHYFIGGAVPMGEFGKLGFELIYLDAGTMRRTTWEDPAGLAGQTFDANDLSIGVAYARNLTDRFNFGVKAKFIRQSISFSSATGFAMDFGSQYHTGFHGLKIGMAVQNFGSKMNMDGSDLRHKIDPYLNEGSNPDDVWAKLETEDWPLPVTIRIGFSMEVLNYGSSRLTTNVEFLDYRDFRELFMFGGEYSLFNDLVFLRGGLSNQSDKGNEEWRVNFGAGLMYKFNDMGFGFDYSYSDLGILEQASRYSIRLTF